MEASEGQIKRVVLSRMGRCRVCHRSYTDDDVSIVSRQPDMWMLAVECLDCHAKNFVAAVLSEGDRGQAEDALRRLTAEGDILMKTDANRFSAGRPRDPITAADVADMHLFLETFDGNFHRLFRDSRRSGA